jgi:uncharacterized protein
VAPRSWTSFSIRGASLRISSSRVGVIQEEVRRQRELLEAYVRRHPDFLVAMTPLDPLDGAPEIARRMARAAWAVGVGPMAAVAGAVAQAAVEAALRAGATEAVVENGGDIFLASGDEVVVGLYAGEHTLSGRVALRVRPERMPLSVCSSSSRMGHSLSLGDCDLATVVARDGALADAAATLACNLVNAAEDVERALDAVLAIPGVDGLLLVKGGRIGVAGDLPELVRHADAAAADKISHDARSEFPSGP